MMTDRRLLRAVFSFGCALSALWVVDASAQSNVCIEDGGTAKCVGPEVGQYEYWVGSTGVPGTTPTSIASEAPGIAGVQSAVLATVDECSSSFSYLPWVELPADISPGSGSRTVTAGADSWNQQWGLNTEKYQTKSSHRIELELSRTSSPPCATHSTVRFGSSRQRLVDCPVGYSPNGPANTHCWRPPGPDPQKNLGPCNDCDLQVGNPVNVATGNKYLEERDYIGSGAFPLEYTRRYNSLAFVPSQLPTTGPRIFVRSPNWQGTYDRVVLLSDHPRFPVARAYRHDGRVLAFKPSGAQWVADADVTERLTRLVDASGNPAGWKLTTAADDTETYDAEGRLLEIRNRAGITHTLGYSSAGQLASVAHSFGGQLSFTYTSNRVATMTVPGGQVYTYGYNWPDNLTSVTYPGSVVRTFHYENASYPRSLTGITDESSVRFSTYAYNTSGKVSRTEHAEGANRFSISYPTDTTTAVTDPLNTARTWTHGSVLGGVRASAISQVCPTCGSASKAKTFDANGNVETRVDFNNIETRSIFDLTRNLESSRTEAYGTSNARMITSQWHPAYRLPVQIEEPGKRTTFTHDANGNVLTRTILDITTGTARTWTYTYNTFGQVLTADGPRTDVSDLTTYTYYNCNTGYQCGQIETITNAAGHLTTYNTYNAHGQPLTMTDPNGVVTTLTYDLRQRLTSRTVGSEVTTFDYWPTGLLKKATLPDASYLEYTYDAAHRLTEIKDAEGNRIVYTLDAMGNRTKEESRDPSNALTQTRTRVFDALNRLWKEIGAADTANVTTTFGYDNNGNQTSMAAPLGRNTGQTYDELNRVKQVTDPLSGITQYGYNALDQLISVTDPTSKVTSYTYNALGDLTQQVSPDTGTTTNTHDAAGNLLTSTDARNTTATYGYDALNRMTSVSYPDQTFSYTYDGGSNQNGRLTQVTDASGATSWTYDPQGRVLSRQQSMGIIKSVGYGYDTYGRLQSLTLPSGNAVTYGYTDGKVTSLSLNGSTTILSNVLYQPFGPTRGWTWGNSTLAIREYDEDGLITDIDSAGLKTYDYDDAFRITDIIDASDAVLSQSYGYDLLDRLTAATGTSLNQSWTYDANGNRLTQGGSQSSTFTVSSTSNRLSSVSGSLTRSYTYDDAGNTTNDGSATFAYNDAGRMVSATKAGTTTTYSLNALGQRVKKITGGTPLYFVYDESGHLLGEYSSTGALIQETIWLGDTPVATIRPDGGGVNVFYVHADHLDTPRRITRPSDDVVVWRWESDPFGSSAADEDPDRDSTLFAYNLRFPGQYYDQETGLNYNNHRDYDPSAGRYLESDPIGLEGGLNTYTYVYSSPLLLTDPDGLKVQICCRLLASKFFGRLLRQRHCYISTDDDIYSLAPNGPEGVFTGIKQTDYLDDTNDAANPDPSTKCKECIPKECADDPLSCLQRAFGQYQSPSRYFPLGRNSNTFAGTLFRSCCQGSLGFGDGLGSTPGINRSPARRK